MNKQDLDSWVDEAVKSITTVDLSQLEKLRIAYLGRKGKIAHLFAALKDTPATERCAAGAGINWAKQTINETVRKRRCELQEEATRRKILGERIDVTLPGCAQEVGSRHPVSQILEKISNIFLHQGFSIETGPEIEDEYHNFEALNIPADHPAREMHDTFYLQDSKYLLRTHTSPVQIRTMQRSQGPLKIIAPGKVYRCDSDPTHSPMFHQVEGLCIGQNTCFIDLRSTVDQFLHTFFDQDDTLKVRFRPSYFPFTEPSCEVDISRKYHKTGTDDWLEVMGAGMVHPKVLKNAGYDPDLYCGYAFGLGVERLTMLYYGIEDLRQLYENDLRFLVQFQ